MVISCRSHHWGVYNLLGVVDAELESSGAPLDQVEGSLCLESGSSSSAVPWNNITTVQKSNRHVFSIARIADNHLVVGLKACRGLVSFR
jgi:hypothetical protein